MPTLYVVRHGRVAANPADVDDPELSLEGQSQAAMIADELRTRLTDPLPILTSPLRRCRETAAPLSAIWRVEPIVEPRIADVPGPPASALPREEWLRRALIAEWPELIALGQTLQDGYDYTLTSWRAVSWRQLSPVRTTLCSFRTSCPSMSLRDRLLARSV